MGESLSNHKLSEAADLISHADTLLILGCNMKSVLPDMSLQFFHGDNIIPVSYTHLLEADHVSETP